MKHNHIAESVFMVRPVSFGFDEQTAATNVFQQRLEASQSAITRQALAEFEAYLATLRQQGIEVVVFEDSAQPPKPNAVFPNNWLSTWPDGRVITYPMATLSRRRERTPAALHELAKAARVMEVLDLSGQEQQGHYLEGTGAIVFDHAHQRGYAVASPRCDARLAAEHIESLGYQPVIFAAADADGVAVYHTNVLMGVQTTTAVICAEAITDEAERARVLASLTSTGHETIEITRDQMAHFCGNVIELQNKAGQRFLVMSQTAHDAFTPQQRAALSQDKTLLPVAIPTIETIGGGSARCMVAEVFLPRLVPALAA
jgi:hypothetical protein